MQGTKAFIFNKRNEKKKQLNFFSNVLRIKENIAYEFKEWKEQKIDLKCC